MYLTTIDSDGLITNDVIGDGWKAIKEFLAVFDKYGREGMTVIALAVDYDSILKNYNEKDRFIRSIEQVYGDRDKLKKTKLIEDALEKYAELQYNSDLERDRVLAEYNDRLVARISIAMKDETENGEKEVQRLTTALQKHEKVIQSFKSEFSRDAVISATAVTKNGYVISRIENDLRTRKNSKFANEGRGARNPNKLGLT